MFQGFLKTLFALDKGFDGIGLTVFKLWHVGVAVGSLSTDHDSTWVLWESGVNCTLPGVAEPLCPLWRSHCARGEGGVAERWCPRQRLRFRVWAEVCG